MKVSRTRFVTIFLVLAFAFQFISNSLLGDEIGLFPGNGEWYPGVGSPIAWKNTMGSILFPVKYILVKPLSFLTQDPDPAPPVLLIAFAIYWTAIALILYYLFHLLNKKLLGRKHELISKVVPTTKAMNRMQELYYEAKADEWFKKFVVFCRIALAASFIPAGFVKIMGERFAEGLPSNNPLGHYFDALHQTGYYYTFIGIVQITIAVLLLIPRTSLLGALMYFPIIVNICVLTYATRFEGTRLVTMMVLASLFLLIWDYDRLKHILPLKQTKTDPPVSKKPLGMRLRILFFGGSIAVLAFIIIGSFYLYEIGPCNSEEACRNQCAGSKNPEACETFCDCIYKQGQPLDGCLETFNEAKDILESNMK